MNGGDWTVTRSAKLRDVTIELTFGPGGFSCEWLPRLPDREFSKTERRRYREARDAIVA